MVWVQVVYFAMSFVLPVLGYMVVWLINGWGYGYWHNLQVRWLVCQPAAAV